MCFKQKSGQFFPLKINIKLHLISNLSNLVWILFQKPQSPKHGNWLVLHNCQTGIFPVFFELRKLGVTCQKPHFARRLGMLHLELCTCNTTVAGKCEKAQSCLCCTASSANPNILSHLLEHRGLRIEACIWEEFTRNAESGGGVLTETCN